MSTENLERISNGHGSTACTGGELEIPWTERRSGERDGRRLLELAEATERYAEESAAVREEAESRVTAPAVQDSDSVWTDELTVNPGSVVVNPAVSCTVNGECSWELSVSDAITDRYREMVKQIEEQDRTIAEMKYVIENLQDIVYRQKLGKEAETLVL